MLRAIPCQRPFEVYEDVVEIQLVLQVFLADDPEIQYLFCGAPSGSETCLLFTMISSACGWNLFRMIFNTTLLVWLCQGLRILLHYSDLWPHSIPIEYVMR